MIAKKNSRLNLERKRIAFFNIGLLGAGSIVLAAFTYTSPLEHEQEKAQVTPREINYIQELVKQKKPDPVKIKQKVQRVEQPKTQPVEQTFGNPDQLTENYKEVDNASTDVKPSVLVGPPGDVLIDSDPIENIIDEKDIVDIPDVEATFIGGYAEMTKFIINQMEYPEQELYMGVGRKVYVYFVVETDGTISNVKIENPEGDGLDREAKRVIRKFPKWKPGEMKGIKVRTSVIVPINFVPAG